MSEASIELLRFTTCGSVDDGKSTLIGRLLFDSKQLFDDQLAALEKASLLTGDFNLANLTDGLKAEREQGITIDVAYRYFATPRRKFIVADTPGHVQYTRNMVTGGSTANLALILVDARQGVIEQTRRHAFISSLLGIPHLVICVNKMDLVGYARETFETIRADFEAYATHLEVRDITFIPMSALKGDNVVELSSNMPWFKGPPLLDFLETVHIANDRNLTDPRFPVQYVIRPRDDEHHDFRGYAGQVASGVFAKGDAVVVLPSGQRSHIADIRTHEGSREEAFAPMSVTLTLADDIDVSRGDTIVLAGNLPEVQKDLDATVCWLHDRPLQVGGRYLLKHGTNSVRAIVRALDYRVDISTLERDGDARGLALNEIGRLQIRCGAPLAFDPYRRNRATGSFILIDERDNATVGAGLIRGAHRGVPIPEGEPEYII